MLYLHHRGIVELRHFEPYSNLRCLHLECNAISSLDGLRALTELSQLCVDGNALRDLRGVERLTKLRHLNANDNVIETLEHARGHGALETLCVRGNRLRDVGKALEPLRACAALRSLDVSRNDIDIDAATDDDARRGLLEALSHVSNVELLYFADGNPASRSTEAYRAVVVEALPRLRWLDDAPVDATSRRLAAARLLDGVRGEIQAQRDVAVEGVEGVEAVAEAERGCRLHAVLEHLVVVAGGSPIARSSLAGASPEDARGEPDGGRGHPRGAFHERRAFLLVPPLPRGGLRFS